MGRAFSEENAAGLFGVAPAPLKYCGKRSMAMGAGGFAPLLLPAPAAGVAAPGFGELRNARLLAAPPPPPPPPVAPPAAAAPVAALVGRGRGRGDVGAAALAGAMDGEDGSEAAGMVGVNGVGSAAARVLRIAPNKGLMARADAASARCCGLRAGEETAPAAPAAAAAAAAPPAAVGVAAPAATVVVAPMAASAIRGCGVEIRMGTGEWMRAARRGSVLLL